MPPDAEVLPERPPPGNALVAYHCGEPHVLILESPFEFELGDLALPDHESGVYVGSVVAGDDGVAFRDERPATAEEWVRFLDGGWPWADGDRRNPHATDVGDADWTAPVAFHFGVDPERAVSGYTWCSLCGKRADEGVVVSSAREGEGRGGAGFFCAPCVGGMAAALPPPGRGGPRCAR